MSNAPKPKAPKPRHVPIGDVALGQKITGRVYDAESDHPTVKALRTVEVKEVNPCPGQWRTHIHVNGSGCWDGRTVVEVSP